MSFAEVLAAVQALPREERLQLFESLREEYEHNDENVTRLLPPGEYPIYTPFVAPEAADELQKVLDARRLSIE
jgi:hypothetical protein